MSQPVEILYAVPIGAVIAWYPPPNQELPLDQHLAPGFAICDGSKVSDPDSPFNGLPTPNLTNRFPLGAGNDVGINSQGGNRRFVLTTLDDGTSGSAEPPSPGWVALVYIMRIK